MSIDDYRDYIGCGIAGNFAHHLEQAGEIVDFVNIAVDEDNAPKGIFPFYVPNGDTFLSTYPLSSDTIAYIDANLQIEPEVGLICDIIYQDAQIINIVPKYFCAYNDCSIRKPNAKKISEKKNWGANSKGISNTLIPIDTFTKGGIMDTYSIASFLKRNGTVYEYGKDSSVITYSYFYDKLIEWMVAKLNTQKDFGPLEDMHSLLAQTRYTTNMIISIGATSYSEFGESTYLVQNDDIYVIVYDKQTYTYKQIEEMVTHNDINNKQNISILHQVVK